MPSSFSIQGFIVNSAVLLANLTLVNTMAHAHFMVAGQTARARPDGPVLSAASTSMNAVHHRVEI